MIRDQPQGPELLVEARRVLVDTVLPGLPAETRYQVLMITRALTLAERQFHACSGIEKKLGEELQQLLDQDGTLPELARILAKRIRNGGFDLSAELYAFLQMIVAFKLKETIPSKVGRELDDSLDRLSP
jgi:hypothetical protein